MKCPKCKSKDVYRSNVLVFCNYRCNGCGEYFRALMNGEEENMFEGIQF